MVLRPALGRGLRAVQVRGTAAGTERALEDFPDGIAQLAVPPVPFRVKAYVAGGERAAYARPFDPAALPEKIEITLPER